MREAAVDRVPEQVAADRVGVLQHGHERVALEARGGVVGQIGDRERPHRGIRCRRACACDVASDWRCDERSPDARLRAAGGRAHGSGDLAELHAEHAGELARVPGAQRGIADLGDDRALRPAARPTRPSTVSRS